MFQRKIYQDMLDWKQTSQGRSALLIQGARRVGKSTIVEAFARKEYESYLLIDFSSATTEVRNLFEDIAHLDYFFLHLQLFLLFLSRLQNLELLILQRFIRHILEIRRQFAITSLKKPNSRPKLTSGQKKSKISKIKKLIFRKTIILRR